ncbi:MAG: 6-pyruvoyl trahydropterin synthase family protein [Arachnia sp.]
MFSLTVCDHIMIAHSLPDPFFGPAQQLHGATLAVEVTWRRRALDPHAVVLDIGEANSALAAVLEPLRYDNLDNNPAFEGRLSTTEMIARHISDALRQHFDETLFAGLTVLLREHPGAWATYDVAFDND